MTDDYYEGPGDEEPTSADPWDTNGNPYSPNVKDYEDWQEPVYRPSKGGILGSYKRQLNLNATDIMEKDYWDAMKNMQEDIKNNFGPAKKETLTKTLITRMRL